MSADRQSSNDQRPALDFRRLFVFALICGIAAIIYSQHIDNTFLAVSIPIVVMAIYLGIGKHHATLGGLLEQFADSVYYLGFLFTLVALTVSLMAFRTEEVNINLLVANFALALITTIFGLAARIVITNFHSNSSNQEVLQDILDHQTSKLTRSATRIAQELENVAQNIVESHKLNQEQNRQQIDNAYRAIELLSENTGKSLATMTDTTQRNLQQLIDAMQSRLESVHFPEELLAEKLSPPIERFASKLNDTGDLLDEFHMQQCKLQKGLENVANCLPGFENCIQESAQKVNDFSQNLEIDQAARQQLIELSQTMVLIIDSSRNINQDLEKQTENTRKILSVIDSLVGQMERIPGEIDVTASAIRQSTHTLVKSTTVLSSNAGNMREKLDGLGNEVDQVRTQFNHMKNLAKTVDKAVLSIHSHIESVNSHSGSLSELERSTHEQLQLITHHQNELQRVLTQSREGLEAITNHFIKAVEYVTDRLRS